MQQLCDSINRGQAPSRLFHGQNALFQGQSVLSRLGLVQVQSALGKPGVVQVQLGQEHGRLMHERSRLMHSHRHSSQHARAHHTGRNYGRSSSICRCRVRGYIYNSGRSQNSSFTRTQQDARVWYVCCSSESTPWSCM